jgi:hypothetical protein
MFGIVTRSGALQMPKQRKVLAQLQVSEVLTKESRDAGSAPFVEFQTMIRDAIEQRSLSKRSPGGTYLEVVSSFGGGDDRPYGVELVQGETLRDSGFQMFWSGVTK